jgi:hypothetical protein
MRSTTAILDRSPAQQLESELDEELSRGREVVNHDADVVHPLDRQVLELVLQRSDFSYQLRTRSARSVFHRLGRPSPSSSMKWTLPG